MMRGNHLKTLKTKNELINILISHKEEIQRFGVRRLGLFGSFVKGSQKEESDIDFLVEFYPDTKNFRNFIHLAFFLEDLFQRRVEIVTPESLSQHLKPYILKEVEYVLH